MPGDDVSQPRQRAGGRTNILMPSSVLFQPSHLLEIVLRMVCLTLL